MATGPAPAGHRARRRPPRATPAASGEIISLNFSIAEDRVLARLEQRVERLVCSCRSASTSAFLSVTIVAAWSRCAPPERLADDLVDEAELLQPRGGDAERLGGLGGMLGPTSRGSTRSLRAR
jgi:hypothetical protein